MQRANNLFIKEAEKSDFFVTIAGVTLDEESGECLYSSYGHQPCLIRRANGQIVTLAPQGVPMGIRRVETPYGESFILKPSDLLILYTDGVTDCQNRAKELFGEERFLEFVKIHGALPPKLFVEDLYQELMRFSAGEESFDDITVMAIKMGEKRSHV
jgi:sigma-B regulation protein RsbU (phosphoserine phosphatase)